MRVTFVVPGLDTSGGARIIAGHAQRLAERGHKVLVVAPSPRKVGLRRRVKSIIGRDTLPSSPEQSHYARSIVAIHQTGRDGPVEVTDVPDADVIVATFWTTAEWIWPMPSTKGTKIHFIQGYDVATDRPNDRIEAVWRLPFHKIAVAQWLIDLGRERFGLGDIALAPNSVDHHLFNPQRRTVRTRPATVGFMFHPADFKDMPTTIAAIEGLKRLKVDTEILSFGACLPRRNQLPAGARFHLLPSQHKIAELYTQCDAWLSTSRMEGFNLPPLEAMATGCPAICSKTGRPLEIIRDGTNGYLVDQGDIAGFVDALARIISMDDNDWWAMSESAAEAVAHPTWEDSTTLLEEALKAAIRSTPLKRHG